MNEVEVPQKFTPRILFIWGYLVLSVCAHSWISGTVQTSAQMAEPYVQSLLGKWHTVYDSSTNALYMWRQLAFVPLLIGNQPDSETAHSLYLVYHTLILFLGITLYHHRTESKTFLLERGLLASVICFLCIFLFREQPLLFALLSWIPLLTYSVSAFQEKMTPLRYGVLFICSIIVTLSANQLSLIVLVITFLLTSNSSQLESRVKIFIVMMIPILLTMLIAPVPAMPNYPQGSLVVPDDNLVGMIRPYIGTTPPIPIINSYSVAALFSKLSLVLLLPAIMLMLSARSLSLTSFQYSIPLVLCIFCVLDISFGSSVASLSPIAPLATIARIIPGYFFFALSPIALCMCIISLIMLTLTLGRASLSRGILLVLGVVCIATKNSADMTTTSAKITTPQTISESELQSLLHSPSYPVIINEGSWIFDRRALIQAAIFRQPSNKELTLIASHEQESIKHITDASKDSRWTRGHATQEGNEWLLVAFTIEKKLDGIELSTGPYTTDFPRGIAISLVQECPADLTTIESSTIPQSLKLKSIIERPLWRGAIEFTPDGFPYYRGTYDVKVYFPETVTGRCFLVQQTGATRESDWSVARLKVLDAP